MHIPYQDKDALCCHTGPVDRLVIMAMTPAQCRAARGLLNLTQVELARISKLGRGAIRLFESEETSLRWSSMTALISTFRAFGVEFIREADGVSGVKFRDKNLDRPRNRKLVKAGVV